MIKVLLPSPDLFRSIPTLLIPLELALCDELSDLEALLGGRVHVFGVVEEVGDDEDQFGGELRSVVG